jgi:hypothetical protein
MRRMRKNHILNPFLFAAVGGRSGLKRIERGIYRETHGEMPPRRRRGVNESQNLPIETCPFVV